MIPYYGFADAIIDFSKFILDIKYRKKIVLESLCKRITDNSGDGVSHDLLIEGYGEIDLIDYNHQQYFYTFSEQFELFEIHIAPKSKFILYAKKVIK